MGKSKAKKAGAEQQNPNAESSAAAALALAQLQASMQSQNVLPQYSNIPNPIFDQHNPIVNAEALANQMLNTVPDSSINKEKGAATGGVKQSKEEITKMAQKVSAKLGFIMEAQHVEDLFVIASTEFELSAKDVWMYFRGAARMNQISVVSGLSKTVSSVEAVLQKNQLAMQQMSEANKLANDKLTLMGKHLEAVIPNLSTLIKDEHLTTRTAIMASKASPSHFMAEVNPFMASTSVPVNQSPGLDELLLFFKALQCPEAKIAELSLKYMGKITWEHYNRAISGKMTVQEGKQVLKRIQEQYGM